MPERNMFKGFVVFSGWPSRGFLGAALLTATAISLAGCGGSNAGSTNSVPRYAGNLTMELDGTPTSLDPAKGESFQDGVVDMAMYNTLIYFDAEGNIVPGLATKWNSTPSSATFTIRNGVTCSDGEKLTGEVVAASLSRYFDPATAAPFSSSVIGGGNTARVTASGQQVTVSLAEPNSGLLAGLALPFTGIVCSAGIKDPSMLATKSDGTGGYVADGEIPGSSYTFKRREAYNWGPAFAGVPTSGERPARLTLKVVQDENTRANLQLTGQLQISDYTTNDWRRVANQPGGTKEVSQQSDTFLIFDEAPGHVTANKAVREAIAQAIDRARQNNIQNYGNGKLISDLGEPTYRCYNNSLGSLLPRYDPAAAAKALKGVKISVIGTTVLAGGDGNTYIETALRSAGAQVTLRNMTNQEWVNDMVTGKKDWDVTIAVLANLTNSIAGAGNFFTGPTPPHGLNQGSVDNTAANAALQQARQSIGSKSCADLTQFQQDLFSNVDVVPLSSSPATVVLAPGVTAMVSKGFVEPGTIRVNADR